MTNLETTKLVKLHPLTFGSFGVKDVVATTLEALDLGGDSTTLEGYCDLSTNVSSLSETNLGLIKIFCLTQGPITDYRIRHFQLPTQQ